MPVLDSPRLPPHSGGAPKSLVIMLHGYGADGRDLIDLGSAWAELLPDTAFVSPHAPDPCEGAPMGRQWFPLGDMDPHDMVRGVASAAPGLHRLIQSELQRARLPASRLALVGFSQGCMMALSAALAMAEPPAAVVGYSGLWVPEPNAAAGATVPPILLVHGTDDTLIPAQALFQSAFALAGAGIPVEWHLSHGLGHGIDDTGLAQGGLFLAQRLAAA
ncbi:dienelactone hydrolase family protein [Xanthobacter sp. VTT E-85241]|uniref:alpha/beta hydrolase n=1 Tax=Roseixanthobacter finlandensis TaxID=3119922 RepID=UPI00372C5218